MLALESSLSKGTVYAMQSFAVRFASCSGGLSDRTHSQYASLLAHEPAFAGSLRIKADSYLTGHSSNPLRSFSLSRLSPALKRKPRLILRKTSFPRPSLGFLLVRSQFCSIFSIKVPYPFVLSLMNTCVTAPISFPFWIIGLPLIP